jgi:hypothetical protein
VTPSGFTAWIEKRGDFKMLDIRSIVAAAAVATFVVPLLVTQNASAAERHNSRFTMHRMINTQVRSAYAAVDAVQSNWSRYEGGAISAPAGR